MFDPLRDHPRFVAMQEELDRRSGILASVG
jgi:hypothetical protein